ncbi:filamentous hemagglutinin N-terminal domain-containing protein [Burkholderia sp. Bp9002]|nr:filamentous hemagglutinin N-terminal domain-containing protein [Burkholderia sp. Bp9002]
MNKTYALVWNPRQRCWNAVGETARRRGKSSGGKRLAATAVSLLGLAALPAFALPTGETLVSGNADFIRSGDGKSLAVNQHTDKLITNWQDFGVSGGEYVSFQQPGSQSIALNRVIGTNGSQIQGNIDANGKVFLVNPNGVVFGSGAQINVGGLVASTQNIADADFLAGNYRFAGNSKGSVANYGRITAADGGGIALLGARVSNHGVIRAKMGRVALGAGNTINVNFDGNGLLNLQVQDGAIDAQAHNGGLLKADGGEVLMTARAADNLLNAVVSNIGTIEAKGLARRGGKITLDGGTVNVANKLDTSGEAAGTIVTRGERVNISADTQVDTRGINTTGTWTIEAANAGVDEKGGGRRSIGAETLSLNLGTTNVALTNTRDNLTVGGPVSWRSDHGLTLTAKNGDVDLQQALVASGMNARVLINASDSIHVSDAVKLTGRNAHLELNSKNGHTFSLGKGNVTLSGDRASYWSNGEYYKVLHTVDDLRNVDANLRGRYVLGNAIDGAGSNFQSIGRNSVFTGAFDGLGNTISGLRISNPVYSNIGLFAYNAGRIANLGLQDSTAYISAAYPGMQFSVGSLVGYNTGVISNVAARDVVVAGGGRARAGGLVGANVNGTIDHATVTGRVASTDQAWALGGLVGENISTQNNAPVAATIRNSHADVSLLSGSGGSMAGGLVGRNAGVIEASSSAGKVVGRDNSTVGGLVGRNDSNGVITASSSSATVTAGQNGVGGGLVGRNDGEISASSSRGTVSGGRYAKLGGLVGWNFGFVNGSSTTSRVDTVAGFGQIHGPFIGLDFGHVTP